jgi:alpha-galactosidase/6-phospho-beta-glucosidase family protein
MDLGRISQLRLQTSLFLQVYRKQLKKENQIGICCDSSKVHVAINHDILLSKLQEGWKIYGLNHTWFIGSKLLK